MIYGTNQSDILIGDSTNTTFYTNGGNDTVFPNSGFDIINGGPGNDTLDYHNNNFSINFMTSNTISFLNGDLQTFQQIDILVATKNSDQNLLPFANGCIIFGDSGNDIFTFSSFNGTLIGGSGTDLVNYYNATSAMTIRLDQGTAVGYFKQDNLVHIENAQGSTFSDLIYGDSL